MTSGIVTDIEKDYKYDKEIINVIPRDYNVVLIDIERETISVIPRDYKCDVNRH